MCLEAGIVRCNLQIKVRLIQAARKVGKMVQGLTTRKHTPSFSIMRGRCAKYRSKVGRIDGFKFGTKEYLAKGHCICSLGAIRYQEECVMFGKILVKDGK